MGQAKEKVGFPPYSQQWLLVRDDAEWRFTVVKVKVFLSPEYSKASSLSLGASLFQGC